jgi:AraC-type DNA-binding domain-containing proteins
MAFIDTNAVKQLLQKINIGDGGYSYIIDESNSVITSVNPSGEAVRLLDIPFNGQGGVTNTEVSGKNMFVSYTVSDINNWKYVAAVPTSYVMMEVNSTRTTVILALFVMLVVGVTLSWVFSYKNAKPIKEINESLKELLGDNNSYKNEYSFLSGSIYSLINRNKDLDEKLNEQVPIIRAAFLRRLLHGNYRDLEEIDSNMVHLDLHIKGEAYVVGIIRISGYRGLINKNILKELDLSRLIINRTIEEKSYGRAVSCDLNETGIALLLSSDSKDPGTVKSEFESLAKDIYGALHSELQIFVAFALGSICTSLLDIGYSYNEARQALDHITMNQEDRLVWYNQIKKQVDSYKYSIDMEQNLIGLVKSGDMDELDKFLKCVQIENFSKRKLTVPLVKLLLSQLSGTLVRLTENLGLELAENRLMEITLLEDVDYAFNEICKCFRELATTVNAKKDRSDDLLCSNLLAYINEEYKKEDLTLYSVASHFNLTETYLYHFFKEKTGMTFAGYLEKLRIDRAYTLITETVYPISEIALQVGYGSVHSFRRAFKRCKGFIPSDLRGT